MRQVLRIPGLGAVAGLLFSAVACGGSSYGTGGGSNNPPYTPPGEPHPDLVQLKLFRDAVDLFVLADSASQMGDLEAAKERLRRGPLVFAGRVLQSQQIIDQLARMDALPSRLLPCGDFELVKSLALAGLGVAVLPRRVARYCQDGQLRRLHPALPFIADEIHLLFRGDAHRTRAFMITKDAIVEHGRALDADYEE
jgi:DNA-binding transcriptional LysR family regulator